MIILQGKEYKSIAEAAKKHELSYNTLLHRIKNTAITIPIYLINIYQKIQIILRIFIIKTNSIAI